jgi:hypothetical protein
MFTVHSLLNHLEPEERTPLLSEMLKVMPEQLKSDKTAGFAHATAGVLLQMLSGKQWEGLASNILSVLPAHLANPATAVPAHHSAQILLRKISNEQRSELVPHIISKLPEHLKKRETANPALITSMGLVPEISSDPALKNSVIDACMEGLKDPSLAFNSSLLLSKLTQGFWDLKENIGSKYTVSKKFQLPESDQNLLLKKVNFGKGKSLFFLSAHGLGTPFPLAVPKEYKGFIDGIISQNNHDIGRIDDKDSFLGTMKARAVVHDFITGLGFYLSKLHEFSLDGLNGSFEDFLRNASIAEGANSRWGAILNHKKKLNNIASYIFKNWGQIKNKPKLLHNAVNQEWMRGAFNKWGGDLALGDLVRHLDSVFRDLSANSAVMPTFMQNLEKQGISRPAAHSVFSSYSRPENKAETISK